MIHGDKRCFVVLIPRTDGKGAIDKHYFEAAVLPMAKYRKNYEILLRGEGNYCFLGCGKARLNRWAMSETGYFND